MHKVLLSIFVLFPAWFCAGQPDTSMGEVYDYLYDFRLSDNAEIESSEFLFENNPVNVNTASLQTLMQLPGMDYSTAAKIINKREKKGYFFSLTELLQIEGLDKAFISSLYPYLILKDEIFQISRRSGYDSAGRAYLIKADLRSGFSLRENSSSAAFTGPAYRQYNKLRLTGENWKFSLKTEKDPGEKEITDFKSFFVQIKNIGILSSLTAGDYYIEFGQGLSRWSPGGNLISRGTAFTARSGRGVVPASGFNETGFLRGLSLDLKHGKVCFNGFVSSVSRDAEVDKAGIIVSLPQDGYHRTVLELSRKGSCRELTYGLIASYSPDSILTAGVILNRTQYNHPVKFEASEQPVTSLFLASAEYSLNLSKLHFNGEAAYSVNRISVCNIMNYEVISGLNITFRQVLGNWGSGLINNTSHTLPGYYKVNEMQAGVRGVMRWGVLYLLYGYKALKQPDGSETLRSESGLTFSGSFGKAFNGELTVNFRNEKSELPGAVLTEELNEIINIRTDIRYKAGANIFFHWRADYCRSPVSFNKKGGDGMGFYSETKFKINKYIVMQTRVTVYKTNSYASRLYELEKDVSGTLYSSLLNGSGTAWYIIAEISLWANAKVAAKFADQTKKMDPGANGQLLSNRRFSVQIDISL